MDLIKLTVIKRYRMRDLNYVPGQVIEIREDVAEFLMRDAPGCFEVASSAVEPEPEPEPEVQSEPEQSDNESTEGESEPEEQPTEAEPEKPKRKSRKSPPVDKNIDDAAIKDE